MRRRGTSRLTAVLCRLRRRAAGFTLIELLVVIAVILILVSLVSPAITQALRSAARAECRGQLSQIGRALSNYAQSFERFLPPCNDDAEGAVGTGYAFDAWNAAPGWVGLGHLVGHGGVSEGAGRVFYCPSLDTSSWNSSMPGYWHALPSHGMYNYVNETNKWYGWHRLKEGTRTIIGYQYRMSGFSEHPGAGGRGRLMSIKDDPLRAVVADQLDWRFGPDFCHKTGLNVLFVDGHTVWYHDRARYVEATGPLDAGRAEYEHLWQLFDKNPRGGVEVATLADQ